MKAVSLLRYALLTLETFDSNTNLARSQLVNAFTGGNLTNNTGLESSENLLIYPASKYSNLAIGFT